MKTNATFCIVVFFLGNIPIYQFLTLCLFIYIYNIPTQKGPEEVIKFCTECVLSEDETPCDVPATLFEDDNNEEKIESGGGGGGLHP